MAGARYTCADGQRLASKTDGRQTRGRPFDDWGEEDRQAGIRDSYSTADHEKHKSGSRPHEATRMSAIALLRPNSLVNKLPKNAKFAAIVQPML